MEIAVNRNLFLSYVGLTASGYELANKDDVEIQLLITKLRALGITKDVLNYFALARTNQTEVNPYWPRGSCLSAASFFITESFEWNTMDEYLQFELTSGASAEYKNEEFLLWIKKLPFILMKISEFPGCQALWDDYLQIIKAREVGYYTEMQSINTVLDKFGFLSEEIKIGFAPNLLQFYSYADYVTKDGSVYVITTHVNTSTMLHEYFHQILKQYKTMIYDYVAKNGVNRLVDIDKMRFYGYMWDYTLESKARALEECLVRGLSIILTSSVKQTDVQQYCQYNEESGFLFVRDVIDYAKTFIPIKDNLSEFITCVMKCYNY